MNIADLLPDNPKVGQQVKNDKCCWTFLGYYTWGDGAIDEIWYRLIFSKMNQHADNQLWIGNKYVTLDIRSLPTKYVKLIPDGHATSKVTLKDWHNFIRAIGLTYYMIKV